MPRKDYTGGKDVHVSVELTGQYDDVVDKLSSNTSGSPVLESVLADIQRVVETVVRIDGGTRSRIADSLPGGMNVEYDSEQVVELLHVLETYGLVELEGNTWKPGPQLEESAFDHN